MSRTPSSRARAGLPGAGQGLVVQEPACPWLLSLVLAVVGAAVLLLFPVRTSADVDADCLSTEKAFSCARNRLEDAKDADTLLAPIVEKHGWASTCVWVQYVHGDNGADDTLLVIINGAPGTPAPVCTTPGPKNKSRAARPALLEKIGIEIQRSIKSAPASMRDRLMRQTKEIRLGNGYGGEARVRLAPAPAPTHPADPADVGAPPGGTDCEAVVAPRIGAIDDCLQAAKCDLLPRKQSWACYFGCAKAQPRLFQQCFRQLMMEEGQRGLGSQ